VLTSNFISTGKQRCSSFRDIADNIFSKKVKSVLCGELNISLHILDTLLLHQGVGGGGAGGGGGEGQQQPLLPSPHIQIAFARALKVRHRFSQLNSTSTQ
jgi:hypothetical protein